MKNNTATNQNNQVNIIHNLPVGYHEAHKSIEDMCILGSGLIHSNVDDATRNAAKRLNNYLQGIWDAALTAQFPNMKKLDETTQISA